MLRFFEDEALGLDMGPVHSDDLSEIVADLDGENGLFKAKDDVDR